MVRAMTKRRPYRKMKLMDVLPDVRDGLSRIDRLVLYELHRAQQEFKGRTVPTAVLYGRVVDAHDLDLSPDELSAILARLGAMN